MKNDLFVMVAQQTAEIAWLCARSRRCGAGWTGGGTFGSVSLITYL